MFDIFIAVPLIVFSFSLVKSARELCVVQTPNLVTLQCVIWDKPISCSITGAIT